MSIECQRSSKMDYTRIGAATQRMYNLWQPLGPIHSTPINEGFVVNHEFDINHGSFAGLETEKITYAHRMIGSDPSAWGVICQKIFQANGESTSGCRPIETDGSGKKKGYIGVDIPQMD